MAQGNEATVRKLYEAFSNGDVQTLESLATEESEFLDVPFQQAQRGKSAFRENMKQWKDIFPDGKLEVRSLVSSGDFVVVEGVGGGTHRGTFYGPTGELKPTGKKVEVKFCDMIRLKDGKIRSVHSYFDLFSLLQDLGDRKLSSAA